MKREEVNSSYRSKKERAEEERKKQLIKKLESEISACEQEEAEINEQLALPEVAADYVRVNELLQKLEGIKLQLDELYNQYSEMI